MHLLWWILSTSFQIENEMDTNSARLLRAPIVCYVFCAMLAAYCLIFTTSHDTILSLRYLGADWCARGQVAQPGCGEWQAEPGCEPRLCGRQVSALGLPLPMLCTTVSFVPQFSFQVSYLFVNRPPPSPPASWISVEAKIADEAKKFLWLITISSRIILLKVNSPSGFLLSQSKTPKWALWLKLAGFHAVSLLAPSEMSTICFFYF